MTGIRFISYHTTLIRHANTTVIIKLFHPYMMCHHIIRIGRSGRKRIRTRHSVNNNYCATRSEAVTRLGYEYNMDIVSTLR